MTKISIIDSMFSHAYSTSNWYKPTYFEWDFKNVHGDVLFFTDQDVFRVNDYPNIKKYAWLVESPVVTPQSYIFVRQHAHLFDVIFTHSQKILDQCKNAVWLPIGGCHLDADEVSLDHEKTKLISMMYSSKKFAAGHQLRFDVAHNFSEVIDVMGSGVDGRPVKKIHSCKDYMYSVAIENCKEDAYFTEKIIDCFLAGVIPIYWGCPAIGNFFNPQGVISFNDLLELHRILSDQQHLLDFYHSARDIIQENYRKALEYKIAEDFLYKNYSPLLIKKLDC